MNYENRMLFALLLGCAFALPRTEPTAHSLHELHARAARATDAAEITALRTDYARLVDEELERAGPIEPEAASGVGSVVVRPFLESGEPTLAHVLDPVSDGFVLVREADGRAGLHPAESVWPVEFEERVAAVKVDGRVAFLIGHVAIGDRRLAVISEVDEAPETLVDADRVVHGRLLAANEASAVVEVDGELKLETVTVIFDDGTVALDLDVYDTTPEGAHPELPRAHVVPDPNERRPVWYRDDDALWPGKSLGRFRGRDVVLAQDGPRFVDDPVYAREASELVGRPAVVKFPWTPSRAVRIAFELTTGHVALDTGEVLAREDVVLDDEGHHAAEIYRRTWIERVVYGFVVAPLAFNSAIGRVVHRAACDVEAALARRNAPPLTADRKIMQGWRRLMDNRRGIYAHLLKDGRPDDPVARNANFLGRKFGAKMYIKAWNSKPRGAFVTWGMGEIAVTHHADADAYMLAHETTHVRNLHAQGRRRRRVARTNYFALTGGRGFHFFEPDRSSSYRRGFGVDEAHGRAVEMGMRLHALEASARASDDDPPTDLRNDAWDDLSAGRRFVAETFAEVARLRDAMEADGGVGTLRQKITTVEICRPLVRRSAREDARRESCLIVKGFTWPMPRHRLFDFAMSRLDETAREAARFTRVFDRLEERLRVFGDERSGCKENLL